MTTKSPKKTSQTPQRASRFQRVRARELANAPHRSTAPFGVTAEGAMLVNIDTLDAVDVTELKKHTLFIGVELGQSERRFARERLENAGHELGAKIAGTLLKRGSAKPE